MKLGIGHDWIRSDGRVECWQCGTRPHWPAAEADCPITGRANAREPVLQRVSWNELVHEMQRALDTHGDDPLYQCISPSSSHARNGWRRTGI